MRYLAKVYLAIFVAVLAIGPVLSAAPLTAHPLSISTPSSARSTSADVLSWIAGGGLAVFGAIKVKDTASVAAKFVQRAGAAAGDYKTGVASAGSDWEHNAQAGEGNYEQGVTAAISDKRFQKGVTGKAAKYQNNAVNLGAQRYPSGIQNAQQAYASGVQPFLDALKGMSLPPKGPRGSAQNQQRASAVAQRLNMLRLGK